MNTILTLLLITFSLICKSQVIFDKDISLKFKQVVKRASPEVKQWLLEQSKIGENMALLTLYKTDTLNKKDITPHSNVRIYNMDGTESRPVDQTLIYPAPYYIAGSISGDSLIIDAGMLKPSSTTKVINGSATTVWNEYTKSDSLFRMSLDQPKTNDLYVPVYKTSIVLGSLHPKPGDIIYGKLQFKTKPYYIDDYGFTTEVIHQCVTVECIFRLTVAINR